MKILNSHILNPHIDLPSSKSLTHRALICAALASGQSVIENMSVSKDTLATMEILKHFGVTFTHRDQDLVVQGGKWQYDGSLLDANESGSTLRFMIPLVAQTSGTYTFIGRGKLLARPLDVYAKLFQQASCLFRCDGQKLQVEGPLPLHHVQVDGSISSQFITGLLLSAPLQDHDVTIEIQPPFVSKAYVNLTLDALLKAGIQVHQEGLTYHIAHGQTFQPFHMRIEGDDSQAAFFILLACIHGQPFTIHQMNPKSHQADHAIVNIAEQLGCQMVELEDGYQCIPGQLRPTTIDLDDCPDLGPALFALATQIEGETIFTGIDRLRIKESDRVACMASELEKLGCQIDVFEHHVVVHGKKGIRSNVTVEGHNDHRIVMALAALATIGDQITINGHQAIAKSYPTFFEDLAKIGVKMEK